MAKQTLPTKFHWDLRTLFPTDAAWEKEFKRFQLQKKKLNAFQNKLCQSPALLAKALDCYLALSALLDQLTTYSHLKHDVDLSNSKYKKFHIRSSQLCCDFSALSSWIAPEILSIPASFLKAFPLKKYRFFLEKILRSKPHTLKEKEEQILSMSENIQQCPHRTFSSLTGIDMSFPDAVDAKGKKSKLTLSSYPLKLQSEDRTLRKSAYLGIHKTFEQWKNTFSELLSGQLQNHFFLSKARNYNSCLHAALGPYQIDPKIYTNLIEVVQERLPSLHRYIRLRKQWMKLKTLTPYDLYVPLVHSPKKKIDYEQAKKWVIDSVSVFGSSYQKILSQGLGAKRWVDVYETPNKRSGAYSSGCFDSFPYILLNYHGTLNDVLTLSHEAGHSMHSYLSRKMQPYHYAQYPIFVAEVASTFHEQLLLQHLKNESSDPLFHALILQNQIDRIRATFFRQTLFAQFELKIHQFVEESVPITADLLADEYSMLNQQYYGSGISLGKELSIEWARVPHFYYNFYVYQYATGISAAHAFIQKVERNPKMIKDYMQFLSSGGSKDPVDLLRSAGVDLRRKAVFEKTIDYFDQLVEEFVEMKKHLR